MFNFFGHKKDKYPLHDQEHVVHNTGLFSSYKANKDAFQEKVQKCLNFINVNRLDMVKKQFSIIEFEQENVILVLGNFRGMAMVKKYSNPGHPLEQMLDYTWEMCWLSYGFDYKESTTYKWYMTPPPEVIAKSVFEDMYTVMNKVNEIVADTHTYDFAKYTVKDPV